jgi:rhamnosyltransferase
MNNERSMPSVAVLLAAYNGESWIDEQVQSILSQQDIAVHLFISVDLSDDNTYRWCIDLESNNPHVTILPYGEKFGGAAKNFFRLIHDVNFSNFEYVSFSDQDDVWFKNKLSSAIKIIVRDSLDVYSGNVLAFWDDGHERLVKKSYPQKRYDYYFEAAGPGCTYVFKQQVLQTFKTFLTEHWHPVNQVSLHDWMIYSYCRSKGMRWGIDDNPMMRYRQHSSNQMGFNSNIKCYLKRVSMVREKWYRSEIAKIVELIDSTKQVKFSLNRWFLIKNFWKLRRRPRDALALLLMLIFGLF